MTNPSKTQANSESSLIELAHMYDARLAYNLAPQSPEAVSSNVLPGLDDHREAPLNDNSYEPISTEQAPWSENSTEEARQLLGPAYQDEARRSSLPPPVPPKDDDPSPPLSLLARQSIESFDARPLNRRQRPVLDAPMFYNINSASCSQVSSIETPHGLAVDRVGSEESTLLAAGEQARRNRSVTLGRAKRLGDHHETKHSRITASPRQAFILDAGRSEAIAKDVAVISHSDERTCLERGEASDSMDPMISGTMEYVVPPIVRRLSAVYSGKANPISVVRNDKIPILLDSGMNTGLNPRFNSRASTIRRNSSPLPISLSFNMPAAEPTTLPHTPSQISALGSHPPYLAEVPRRVSTIPKRRYTLFAPSPVDIGREERWADKKPMPTPYPKDASKTHVKWMRRSTQHAEKRGKENKRSPHPLKDKDRGESIDRPRSKKPGGKSAEQPIPCTDQPKIIVTISNLTRATTRRNDAPFMPLSSTEKLLEYGDDELLALKILKAYTDLRGRAKIYCLARTIVGVQMLHFDSHLDAVQERSKSFGSEVWNSERIMFGLLLNPRKGRGARDLTEWIARVNAESGDECDSSGDLNDADGIDANEAGHRYDKDMIKILEGWSATRILLATLAILVLSLAATLLWIFLGNGQESSFGPINLVGAAGGQSETGAGASSVNSSPDLAEYWRGPVDRVQTGLILGLLVLLLGWTGMAAWLLLSWLVM